MYFTPFLQEILVVSEHDATEPQRSKEGKEQLRRQESQHAGTCCWKTRWELGGLGKRGSEGRVRVVEG